MAQSELKLTTSDYSSINLEQQRQFLTNKNPSPKTLPQMLNLQVKFKTSESAELNTKTMSKFKKLEDFDPYTFHQSQFKGANRNTPEKQSILGKDQIEKLSCRLLQQNQRKFKLHASNLQELKDSFKTSKTCLTSVRRAKPMLSPLTPIAKLPHNEFLTGSSYELPGPLEDFVRATVYKHQPTKS